MHGPNGVTDTFTEQVVKIKGNAKTKATRISIWVVFLLFAAIFITLGILFINLMMFLFVLAAISVIGAVYLSSLLNIEFEYIFTNGEIDIDRIINGRKRERMASFKCSDIENIEKYNEEKIKSVKGKYNVYYGCDIDENSFIFTVKHPKNGFYLLVISPDEKLKTAMKRYLGYSLKNNL